MEGSKLVLICSVVNATGNITYLWYRGALGSNLKTKTQHSLSAEFEITEMKRRDAEQYYCAADNGYGPVLSELVSIAVRGTWHSYLISTSKSHSREWPLATLVGLSL